MPIRLTSILLAIACLVAADEPIPPDSPAKFLGLIGEYGPDDAILYILERDGRLHAQARKTIPSPLKEVGEDAYEYPGHGPITFRRDPAGRAFEIAVEGHDPLRRRPIDGENGQTFRIKPVRSVEEIRRETVGLKPPVEPDKPSKPDLVDLVDVVPGVKLDIRYATSNNFLGTPLYTSARALMQRPAAEALAKVQAKLAPKGYGLLIHDAYRPWRVTKLFWEATPEAQHTFVADPAKGSKHNRGCAVDLTLRDLKTGKPVQMVGGYDEFSDRSYPDYPGGTARQRWHRELLRAAMEAEGFAVNEAEWWHFDFHAWQDYPIIDTPFEALPPR
jgi:D-alanyl-D-alanine dipeptidase